MMTNRKAECLEMNGSGFTLIEVLVAIVILSVGLLGMASLTVAIIQENKLSNDLTTATTLAQEKMEDIRNLGYAGTPASDSTVTEDYGNISGYPGFKRVTVTDVYDAGTTWPPDGLKDIKVTVSWVYKKTHSVEVKTLLAK